MTNKQKTEREREIWVAMEKQKYYMFNGLSIEPRDIVVLPFNNIK